MPLAYEGLNCQQSMLIAFLSCALNCEHNFSFTRLVLSTHGSGLLNAPISNTIKILPFFTLLFFLILLWASHPIMKPSHSPAEATLIDFHET